MKWIICVMHRIVFQNFRNHVLLIFGIFFPVILGTFIVAIICSPAEMLAYCFFLWFYFYEIKAEIKNMLKYTCNSFKKFILF
jgi:pheromone shutdown protein TraB